MELKVLENGFEWGYKAGPADVRFEMRSSDKGEWVETGDVKFSDNTPADIRNDVAQAELKHSPKLSAPFAQFEPIARKFDQFVAVVAPTTRWMRR
jgi:hypothetical protein